MKSWVNDKSFGEFSNRYWGSCTNDGSMESYYDYWQASREALWNELDTTDFIVMGAQATQSPTVENQELWDVYWRAVDLIKAKLKERELSSNKESGE